MSFPLAQAAESGGTTLVDALPWLALVVVVSAVLLFVLSMVRRRMRADDAGVARDFTLGDLRRLRDEGKLTDDELTRAKSALVGRTHASLAATAKPAASPHETRLGAETKR